MIRPAKNCDSPICDFAFLHGDGLKDISLRVPDATNAYREAVQRGARGVAEPQWVEDEFGKVELSSIATYGDVVHTFVNESGGDARWLNMHAPDHGFAEYLRAARDGEDVAFDSFDPPADGGLPATGATVTGPGEGERVASGTVLLKGVLPVLCVAEWTVDASSFVSKGRNTPYGGQTLRGLAELTVVDGRVIHRRKR